MSAEQIDYDKLVKDHLRLRLIDSGWNDKLNQLIQKAIIKRTENGQTANTIKFEELYKDVVDDARDAITEDLENEFHQKIGEYLSLNPHEESNSSIPSLDFVHDSTDVPMEVSSDVSSNVTPDIRPNIIISDIPLEVLTSDDSYMEAECSYNHEL